MIQGISLTAFGPGCPGLRFAPVLRTAFGTLPIPNA